jgi:probable addiction module antidote protein
MPLKDFSETFENELRNPEFATHFVQAALDDSYETGDIGIFLVALRDVAQANRAMARTARRARVARPSLYKTLSEDGKPQFETVFSLMPEMGFRFSVTTVAKQKVRISAKRRRAASPASEMTGESVSDPGN